MSRSRPRLPIHGAAAISTTRGRASRVTARLALAAVTAAGGLMPAAAASPAASAASTLVVEADQPYRSVTHVASGSLYGLATASVPADSLVEPLHPNTFVQMAAGGKQQAEGDILVVAPEAAKAGARLVDRMSDYYAGWPYQYSASTWPTIVKNQVQEVEASAYAGITNFELWNEPDNTWLSSNGSLQQLLDHDVPAGPLPRPERGNPGPELLRQHQRHAELPAERGRDQHRPQRHLLARTGKRREDRRRHGHRDSGGEGTGHHAPPDRDRGVRGAVAGVHPRRPHRLHRPVRAARHQQRRARVLERLRGPRRPAHRHRRQP